jgi:aminoglycoside phosphotransferase (APT) family kinase protein
VEKALEAARALARVHRVPLGELGVLSMFARAPAAKSPAEEARALHDLWRAHERGGSPTIEAAFRWLHANASKVSDQRALVHGDYQFYNIIYNGETLDAVLDWELAHVGHPGEDLGFIRGCVTPAAPWSAFMEAYRGAGGAEVSDRDVAVFAILSNLRLMSYVLRGRAFFEAGETDSIQKAEVAVYFLPRLMQQVSRVMREIIGPR